MRRLFTILLASSLMQAGTGCSGAVQNSRDNQTNETTQSVTYEADETETTSSEEQKESENMKNITVTVGDQSFRRYCMITKPRINFMICSPWTLK